MIFKRIKFDNYPTERGIMLWIRFIKWFLGYSLLSTGLLLAVCTYMIFSSPVTIPVKSVAIEKGRTYDDYKLSGIKSDAQLEFKGRNIFDNIFASGFDNKFDVFNLIFTVLVLWQLLKIFNELNLNKPFSLVIAKRLKFVSMFLILHSLLALIKFAYLYHTVKEIAPRFRYNNDLVFADINSFKFGILLLIIAIVYKRGCFLQQEQDLTV